MLSALPWLLKSLVDGCGGVAVSIGGPDSAAVLTSVRDVGGAELRFVAIGEPADLALIGGHTTWALARPMIGRALDTSPVVVVDGVDWPTGRRDRYPDGLELPQSERQPSRRGGIVPGGGEPDPSAGLHRDCEHALDEHAVRNGVRTAVEDALAGYDGEPPTVTHVPGFGGVVVLLAPLRADVQAVLESPALLRTHIAALEAAKIEQQIRAQRAEQANADAVRDVARAEHATLELAALRERAAPNRPARLPARELASPPVASVADELLGRVLQLDALRLATAGGEPPLAEGDGARPDGAVSFVLAGLGAAGSGGAHSVVQEARALDAAGVDVRIAGPRDAHDRFIELYPEARSLYVPHDGDVATVLPERGVVVATEARTVAAVAGLLEVRPASRGAYYIQDYEPLFGPRESSASDLAMLSYRRAESWTCFAKTSWLVASVRAAHGIDVARVPPSLDHVVHHPRGRAAGGAKLRVTAMVRPATPRRRAAPTLELLSELAKAPEMSCTSFGCTADELDAVCAHAGVDHAGVLTRDEVAHVLRASDVFVDLSTYQAFGRTGLEAMACGAVPVVPRLGGCAEYARDGENAVVVDTSDRGAVLEAVRALASDRERLAGLAAAGLETASRYSIERTSRAIATLMAGALART